MFDRNIAANNTFSVTGSSHTGLENPADPNSKACVSVFENLTTYKNRNDGMWGRGEMHLFRNIKFADNAMGFTHAAGGGRHEYTSRVVDSLFVGETENIGNPTNRRRRRPTAAACRSPRCRTSRSAATSTTTTGMTW